jgi:hypothetical protein
MLYKKVQGRAEGKTEELLEDGWLASALQSCVNMELTGTWCLTVTLVASAT